MVPAHAKADASPGPHPPTHGDPTLSGVMGGVLVNFGVLLQSSRCSKERNGFCYMFCYKSEAREPLDLGLYTYIYC